MSRLAFHLLGVAGLVGAFAACSAIGVGGDSSGFGGDDSSGGEGGQGATGGSGTGEGGISLAGGSGVGGSPSQPGCQDNPGVDDDGDGFADPADCNDCDPNVNPAAIEVGTEADGEPVDENCDGEVDNIAALCDGGIQLADPDPINAARSMDICQQVSATQPWGLLGAAWVRASGTALTAPTNQFGVQTTFGPNVTPRGGDRMLALATGRARTPDQAGACTSQSCPGLGAGNAPNGFPQDVPNCPGDPDINDDVALQVQLRAPSNATGFQFDFKFYSFEYPEFVCTSYNDQFIALMNPAPMGSINGNISFDSQNNPVSVNVAFFDVCDGCPLGTADMQGTGFNTLNNAGGTGWLVTSAPVTGGQDISIRFAIWDTGDTAYDSTVLVDNFKWVANGGTVPVGTVPVPE
ncbi:choice-of-anchor L domain-containing protein [Chondromyces apiculatus]|uniref:Cell division protein FtsH n=1 Tax=Chondromyces apiculatus DSM 436 TaxID=1192034 RepID=A0A017SZ26_9BACT|nr:choice-of-anchor L domain-containing protein [Chondromyces apiculatus]EYF02012.1 Hypothetical protein CAP_7491 [Chondromyces apiculatus DSM 436]